MKNNKDNNKKRLINFQLWSHQTKCWMLLLLSNDDDDDGNHIETQTHTHHKQSNNKLTWNTNTHTHTTHRQESPFKAFFFCCKIFFFVQILSINPVLMVAFRF